LEGVQRLTGVGVPCGARASAGWPSLRDGRFSLIWLDGPWFKDQYGRTLMLRGVNLGGSSKVPYPSGATHIREGLFDHRNVSFVGRPFPLQDADEHFARLRSWGLTFIRLLVTWEAIEHAGPGIYDEQYLDYLVALVHKAGEHGLKLFIDPHQDAWSRMSGGDGAPGWTLELVGMDVTRIPQTGAAIVHAIAGRDYPRMIWPTNCNKLAAATMFTLFFAGSDFAPRTKIMGEPAQEFLQRHYIAAVKQVVSRLKGMRHVVGYDTMNEPSEGFIGWPDLNQPPSLLRLGDTPTPFQAMLLAAGYPQQIEGWELGLLGPRSLGQQLRNEERVRLWMDGFPAIWRENGVWDVGQDGEPLLLRPRHFAEIRGRPVLFRQYLAPFLQRFAEEIRSVDPEAAIFVEGPPRKAQLDSTLSQLAGLVAAPHWYDGLTLFTTKYRPYLALDLSTGKLQFTPRGNWRSFAAQLARIKSEAQDQLGPVPVLIGECGVPFNLQGRGSGRGGSHWQARAMDATLRALEANLLSYTLWNYTADNDSQHGDQWNGEDLSIFSRDRQANPSDINSGGRALEVVIRPYARAIAGRPLHMRFDYRTRRFEFEFEHDSAVQAPTEVFVPLYQYPAGVRVTVTDGDFDLDLTQQRLTYQHTTERRSHLLSLEPA